jgi:lipoprotein-anchoring transpeptidase ErfK/SrfK
LRLSTKEIFSKQNTCKGRFSIKTVGQLQRSGQNLPLPIGKFFLKNLLRLLTIISKGKYPVFLNRSLWICVSSAVLALSVQPYSAAQTAARQPNSRQAAAPAAPLEPLVVTPELPSIEPVLPEVAEDVRLVLRLRERKVYVYQNDELKTTYPVAVGRAGWETPTGSFEVLHMLQDPGWTNPLTGEVVPPGPNNPLGERWIAFWTDGNNYIGFHGTPNPETVGRAASHGCIRMYNEDVRELYEIVTPGTLVVVEP